MVVTIKASDFPVVRKALVSVIWDKEDELRICVDDGWEDRAEVLRDEISRLRRILTAVIRKQGEVRV